VAEQTESKSLNVEIRMKFKVVQESFMFSSIKSIALTQAKKQSEEQYNKSYVLHFKNCVEAAYKEHTSRGR